MPQSSFPSPTHHNGYIFAFSVLNLLVFGILFFFYSSLFLAVVLVFLGMAVLLLGGYTLHAKHLAEARLEQRVPTSASSAIFEPEKSLHLAFNAWQRFEKIGLPILYLLLIGLVVLGLVLTLTSWLPVVDSQKPWHYALLLSLGILAFLDAITAYFIRNLSKHEKASGITASALGFLSTVIFIFVLREWVRSYAQNAHLPDPFNAQSIALIAAIILFVFLLDFVFVFFRTLYRTETQRRSGEFMTSYIFLFLSSGVGSFFRIRELLEFQFGITLNAQFFSRFFTRGVIPFILIQFLILWGLSFFVVIGPGQSALTPDGKHLEPGFYFLASRPSLYTHTPYVVFVEEPLLDQNNFWKVSGYNLQTTNTRNLYLNSNSGDQPILSLHQFSMALVCSEKPPAHEKYFEDLLCLSARAALVSELLSMSDPHLDLPQLSARVLATLRAQKFPVTAVRFVGYNPPPEITESFYARTTQYFNAKTTVFNAEKSAVNKRNQTVIDASKLLSNATCETLDKSERHARLARQFNTQLEAAVSLGELYKTLTALQTMKAAYAPLRKLFFAFPVQDKNFHRIMMDLDLKEDLAPSMLDPIRDE